MKNRGTDTVEVLLHYFLSLPKLESLWYGSSIWLPATFKGRVKERKTQQSRVLVVPYEQVKFFLRVEKKRLVGGVKSQRKDIKTWTGQTS